METGKPGKPSMSSLKTGSFERSYALTRLGLGAGSKIVAHSLMNIFRGEVAKGQADRDFYRRQSEVLARELGQLKGSVMKAGQMLSLYGQYFLPEEAMQVLSELQDDTAPVTWSVVYPMLRDSLGASRLAELEIDENALAAASLGQAHRARRKSDGLEVVVKIQYPGVAAAIDSDMRTLQRLLTMTRLAPKGLDMASVFAEVREMLLREVDYVAERRFTEEFGRRLAGDPRFAVPRTIPEYCTDCVLTTTYESGVNPHHESVQSLSLERRNRLGRAFIELYLTEFFDWGMVQTDPHFGNYRIRVGDTAADDRIVLLDFGATRMFPRPFIEGYAELARGAIRRDAAQIAEGARTTELMPAGAPPSVLESFAKLCMLVVEPFSAPDQIPPTLVNADGGYRWGDSDLPMRAANVAARSALSTYFRVPPREIVFLHRRLAGVFIMLAVLRAELDARPLLLKALHLE